MYFLTSISIFLAIIVAEASPLVHGNRVLTEVFVKITKALDGIQVGNCVDANPTLPLCDMNPALPAPSHGLKLKLVALGRGTQNYTCSSSDESASPVAVGAVATLFDASCLVSHSPTILHELPSAMSKVSTDALGLFAMLLGQMTSRTSSGLILGEHYFTGTGAPMFDLRIGGHKDWIRAKEGSSVPAPSQSSSHSKDGDQNVPWLQLGFADGLGIRQSPPLCASAHKQEPLQMDPAKEKHYVSADNARTFVHSVLTGNGVSPENATIIADCLVRADLRGVDTHGINRIPSYMERIRQGVLDAKANPVLNQITPVVAQVDGQNGFGFVAAHLGMKRAIEMAREFGIGFVSVKHSNHFGMSAWVVQQALDAGMMSLVFTNSSPALPVWGGREKLMGVSPLACGAPAGKTKPFILDMAPSIAARGKIYKAARRGEKIPGDWALDGEGRPTDDPNKALEGVMLPMGGPKGSALAVMMDVFSGVLSGSAFAGHVTNPYDPSKPADVGHFLVAIKPDLFMGLEDFKERMDYLYQRVVGSEKMAGVDRIYFPGEIEQITHEERLKTGIPYVQAEIDALNREAERVGAKEIVLDLK
ncbi:uncharacterized protein CDV56_104344 [Aspergillus thermomutatus]|uniref:Malate/L-lactate dehydrogenase n=1 Tax=Aspergillus thermomutatus TaxID=41047 RepID=A0A397G9T3_ASPTH|nr:uncharacterized protein CDV56_104344 [Aspergillus thermomutatus]RHZ46654.1 hypothetical protein CDV56_104344 [Aspergillus thermomutatus]